MSETGKNLAGIPEAVIRRLPIYYRELSLLQRREVERISSQELANRVGVKAPQIRQDLSIFGRFGQQGYGYRVEELLAAIERILGLDRQYRLVIVGAGNIGAAVARYPSFRAKGFEVLSLFDQDERLIGTTIGGVSVRPAWELESFLESNPVDIGVIAVPAEEAVPVAKIMVHHGIRGIWNFAPIRIEVPDHVSVEYVNLGESLYSLAFQMNLRESKDS
ncbi:MAG: redox-sensing transcriptional repressor Rex [Firmicutes bacterium]|nr:redox-sensing transcriptional repressor Rex [Bacillota bacterium]